MQNLEAQRGNDLHFGVRRKDTGSEVRGSGGEGVGADESRGGIAATEYFVVVRGFAPLRSTRYSELSQ